MSPSESPAAPAPIDPSRLDLDSFRGRPVAVLGLARSGLALVRFLVDRGALVTAYDGRPREALVEGLATLGERPVRLLLGPGVDPGEALRGQALVCTSPSVSSRYPTSEPRLRAALAEVEAEGRVPVLSEMDLFLRLCPARTVGVTGTKGKTTTSSLIAAVLAEGPAPAVLGGNIGIPLVERLPELTAEHRVVLEISELQLPTLSRGTDVAVYTHVTADHLDRHGSLEAYRAVKRRLVELLPRVGGALVRNADDPVVSGYAAPPGTLDVPYTTGPPPPGGVGIAEGWIVDRMAGSPRRVLPLDAIGLPGGHNHSNVCAAAATGLLEGIEAPGIRRAVERFRPVEHRLEPVATIDDVRFVNDSQGTQPDAVIAALRAFDRPLVLIAGGRSKGVPLEDLARVAAERASAAVLIGESAAEMAALLEGAGLAVVERATDLRSAVRRAAELAAEARAAESASGTATVLLSPAAASFDMFPDYEARGRAFKAAVAELAERERGR